MAVIPRSEALFRCREDCLVLTMSKGFDAAFIGPIQHHWTNPCPDCLGPGFQSGGAWSKVMPSVSWKNGPVQISAVSPRIVQMIWASSAQTATVEQNVGMPMVCWGQAQKTLRRSRAF